MPDTPAVRWRRLLWPLVLATLIHAVALVFVRPPPAPIETITTLRSLVYTAPRAAATTPPPTRAARSPRPRAAPVLTQEPAREPAAPTPEPAGQTPEPALVDPPPAAVTEPAAPETPPTTVPGSLRLKYTLEGELNRLRYHASGELLWAHDGQNYEARMEIGAFLLGSRVQSSQGRIARTGLQPLRFVDRVRHDRVVEFDREKSEIRFSEGAPTMPLPDHAQDQLSVFVQLGSQIGSAPRQYPSGTEVALSAIGVHGPETVRFVVVGDEPLALPGGEQATLKLTRAPAKPDEPRAEVWLAPALGWLPVRIRLSQDNGDFIDQQWSATRAP